MGWPLSPPWVALSLALYRGAMGDLGRAATAAGEALPDRYRRLYRACLVCGFPAFAAAPAIIRLMMARPALG